MSHARSANAHREYRYTGEGHGVAAEVPMRGLPPRKGRAFTGALACPSYSEQLCAGAGGGPSSRWTCSRPTWRLPRARRAVAEPRSRWSCPSTNPVRVARPEANIEALGRSPAMSLIKASRGASLQSPPRPRKPRTWSRRRRRRRGTSRQPRGECCHANPLEIIQLGAARQDVFNPPPLCYAEKKGRPVLHRHGVQKIPGFNSAS